MSKWWQNFHFWVNYPFKVSSPRILTAHVSFYCPHMPSSLNCDRTELVYLNRTLPFKTLRLVIFQVNEYLYSALNWSKVPAKTIIMFYKCSNKYCCFTLSVYSKIQRKITFYALISDVKLNISTLQWFLKDHTILKYINLQYYFINIAPWTSMMVPLVTSLHSQVCFYLYKWNMLSACRDYGLFLSMAAWNGGHSIMLLAASSDLHI